METRFTSTKADAEIKDHGKILSDTKSVLENLAKDGNKLQARLTEVEQKLSKRGGAPGEQVQTKSIGDQFTDSQKRWRLGIRIVPWCCWRVGSRNCGDSSPAHRSRGVFRYSKKEEKAPDSLDG